MILRKYLSKTCALYFLYIFTAFFCVQLFVRLSADLSSMQTNGSFLKVFQYAFLTNFSDLYGFAPFLILLSTLLALGSLQQLNEISVMRVYGLSLAAYYRNVLTISLVLIVVITAFGEVVFPNLSKRALALRLNSESKHFLYSTDAGLWLYNNDRVVYITRVNQHHSIEGMTVFKMDVSSHWLKSIFTSDLAVPHRDHNWNFLRTESAAYSHSNDSVRLAARLKVKGKLPFDFGFLKKVKLLTEHSSIIKIYQQIKSSRTYGIQSMTLQRVFWERVYRPFTSIAIVILVIPLSLTTGRHVNTGLRIVFGVMIGFACFALSRFLSNVFPVPMISALVPALLFGIVGIMILFFVEKKHMLKRKWRVKE